MSRALKWILGITLGLVILAGVGFLAASFLGYGPMRFWGYGHPMMYSYGFDDRAPLDGFRDFHRPMMGGRGFGGYGFVGLPFFFFGGFLRLIFPLAVLALVAFFSYRAGKNAGMRAAQTPLAPEPPPSHKPEVTE